MRKVADDDFKAFERLHQRYAPILMRLFDKQNLDHTSIDDLVQRIFIDLWKKRKSFRGESSFETYLFSMAKRSLNKELRRFYKMAEKEVKGVTEFTPDSYIGLSEPEAELYLQELTKALEDAEAKLTDEQRKALEASQVVDTPLVKVLEGLGCTHGAFKNRLKRARKRLKELLAPFLSED